MVERAAVSRRTFYELFDDREDCILAAFEDALARVAARVLPAYSAACGAWHERIRVALIALLGFFDEQPMVARLLVVEWFAAGSRALERRQEVLERIAAVLEEEHVVQPCDPELQRLAAEGTVGAIAAVLHARITGPRAGESLLELTNPLMSIFVLPYLGPAASRRELERAQPTKTASQVRGNGACEDVLKGLNMRLTYRTIRVLVAVAENPGSSNRVVARAAGRASH